MKQQKATIYKLPIQTMSSNVIKCRCCKKPEASHFKGEIFSATKSGSVGMNILVCNEIKS